MLATTPVAAGQDIAAPQRFANAEREIKRLIATHATPAISVAVFEDDAVVWAAGFGVADRSTGRAATKDTIYRLASISKPFTATALMTLVDRGLIDQGASWDEALAFGQDT